VPCLNHSIIFQFLYAVLDRLISSPFVATFLFVDMFLLSALIFCFRRGVDGYLLGHDKTTILRWVWAANGIVFYFEIREYGKGIALTTMAKSWRSRVFWNFDTFVNIICLFMLICCILQIRCTVPLQEEASQNMRSLFAITTGLLWMRFLSLMKSINIKLATFVLAIVQVSIDVRVSDDASA